MKLNLRKMITVSAAALMLAGVGASATNAGAPVHASRRTMRMSTLRIKENRLNKQIRSDQSQVKGIKHEMARLSKKSVKKGKRSKQNVKRNKRAKKRVKKNVRRNKSAKKNNAKKLTPQQKEIAAAQKQRIHTHLNVNGRIYKVVINGLHQIIAKPVGTNMTVKSYNHKYHVNKINKAYNNDARRAQKFAANKDQAGLKKFENSKKVQNDVKAFQKTFVFNLAKPSARK